MADYFSWQSIIKPQGKHYMIFYRNLEKLKQTFVIAQRIENNKIIKYEWPLIAQTKTIKTIKNKIENIEITLNPYLLNYYRWQRANVPIDISETKKLNKNTLTNYLNFCDTNNVKLTKIII